MLKLCLCVRYYLQYYRDEYYRVYMRVCFCVSSLFLLVIIEERCFNTSLTPPLRGGPRKSPRQHHSNCKNFQKFLIYNVLERARNITRVAFKCTKRVWDVSTHTL